MCITTIKEIILWNVSLMQTKKENYNKEQQNKNMTKKFGLNTQFNKRLNKNFQIINLIDDKLFETIVEEHKDKTQECEKNKPNYKTTQQRTVVRVNTKKIFFF
jgi:nucleotidyltransferase/DNA polymerase involved in DNA repair